jgi:hypothetical protein
MKDEPESLPGPSSSLPRSSSVLLKAGCPAPAKGPHQIPADYCQTLLDHDQDE